jgi:hypothetical protein
VSVLFILAPAWLYNMTLLQSTDRNSASPARQLCAVRKRLSHHKHTPFKVAKAITHPAPSIEVVGSVDRPADSTQLLLILSPHREVLSEGPRALNRRLVYTLRSVESIVGALGGEIASQCPRLTRGEHVPSLDDVVFDERVAGPSVEREVAGALGVVLSLVSYCPIVP